MLHFGGGPTAAPAQCSYLNCCGCCVARSKRAWIGTKGQKREGKDDRKDFVCARARVTTAIVNGIALVLTANTSSSSRRA